MIVICYEDELIIAVNKPNNILVHHSAMARNQSEEKSLIQLLFDKYQLPFYPIHRLDRKTSGVLLFAKQKEYVAPFQELFVNNKIQKTYYGIVRGHIAESGKIDTPVKGRDANIYKEALTYFRRLNTVELDIPVPPYDKSRYSLVELTPKTGRLHQLRIHLNKVSHPLIGDPKYGDRFHNRMYESKFSCSNMFLHSKQLELIHPFTNEELKITAGTPINWHTMFKAFNWL